MHKYPRKAFSNAEKHELDDLCEIWCSISKEAEVRVHRQANYSMASENALVYYESLWDDQHHHSVFGTYHLALRRLQGCSEVSGVIARLDRVVYGLKQS